MKSLLDLHALSRERARRRRRENSMRPDRRLWSGETWLHHNEWLYLTETDRMTWRNVTAQWRV